MKDEDELRLDRLLTGLDLGRDNRAASAWRGMISAGVIYYGEGDGSDARGVARLGRELARPHGWRDARVLPTARGEADTAWRRAYAALRGSFPGLRPGLDEAVRLSAGRPVFRLLRGLCFLPARNGFGIELDAGAIADVERAAAELPGSAWALMALGLSEYLRKNMHRARERFEAAAALSPGWVWPGLLAADSLYYNSSFPEASARFEAALKLDAGCAVGQALLGRARYLQGDPAMIDALDRAIALEPRSGWIYAWRGAAWALRRDRARARRDYERASALMPRYERTQTWYGAWLGANGREAEGLRRLRRGEALNPHYEVNRYAQSSTLQRMGRHAAARRAMDGAILINLATTWERGWTDVQDADPACARALESLRALLARFPSWERGRAWFGQTALLLRRYEQARPALERARRSGALKPWPAIWLGLIERRCGRASPAESLFSEAVEAAPETAWGWAGRGAARLDQGRFGEALSDLDRALELDRRAGRGLAVLWRALARRAAGQDDGAREDARAALEWYPHWRHWLEPLMRGERRRPAAVLDAPGERAEPASYDGPAWVRRGRRRIAEGDAAGALEDLSRVLEECLDPACAEALVLRARAHALLGDAESAAFDLARAKALGR